MDTWKLMLLLVCLSGYCCAGPVKVKRNIPIVQRYDQPMISQPAGPEEDQPEDQRAPPDLMSTLTLPSNATSIRAEITDNFSCENKMYGYYADVENDCQIFHVCLPVTYADGKENIFRWSFICPEETIFSQESFTCMRPDDMNFDCKESLKYYELNGNFGAVTEDANTNSNNNNNNVMATSNEPEEITMVMQPQAQQPVEEEPMEVVSAPPKPTLTQPMKETKKPVKVQVPNRRKPTQTQTGIMKKPASTLPLRKLPQVVPNIEPAPAIAIETKPAEEEERPIYQKYHKRPTTVQAASFHDKLHAKKPVKTTPVRTDLYNQVRKRPTYSHKTDTSTKETEDERAEMSQPELSAPVPTLKLETIFMPAQKPEFESYAAETRPDNTAQASVVEEFYVKPEEDINSAVIQADIPSKPVKTAETYEENEALIPESPKTPAENLATVEGVLKTEEPVSVEENITSVESLKSPVLTAESAVVAETAVVSEKVVEPEVEVSEIKPVVKFVTAEKQKYSSGEVQESAEEKLVVANEADKGRDEENATATDEQKQPDVKFTPTKEEEEEKAAAVEEKTEVKFVLPNEVEKTMEEPATSVSAEVENVAVKLVPANQAEKTETDREEEEKEDEKPSLKLALENQAEETKKEPEMTVPYEVESTEVKFVSANPAEFEIQPELSKSEEEQTTSVKFVPSNPLEIIETQSENAEVEEEKIPAAQFLLQHEQAEKMEETETLKKTQETEANSPELAASHVDKTDESEIKLKATTDFDISSQLPVEAIEEIPAVIVEVEDSKPTVAEEQATLDEMNTIKTLKAENPEHEGAEAVPADVVSNSLEQLEDARPINAMEGMEATPAMQEHDPIVQAMFANTLKQSSGGFKPVDPDMAAEAEALITDFLSTLMKSESSNNKPIYPGEAQTDSDIIETYAEENKMESEESVKETENEAKVQAAPEVAEAGSQLLKNGAPVSSMLMFNQLPESMYQIPVEVLTSPDEAEKSISQIVEKHEETHANQDALHVKNAHEEASQNEEVVQAQPEHMTTSAEEEELASNSATDVQQQLKTVVDTVAYTPLSIDDIVELVKERLDQKPAATQVNWAENSEPQTGGDSVESETIVDKLESSDEVRPNEQQSNEEIFMPIYQRVIDADPNMLKTHHDLQVNEPTAIITESKPTPTQIKPEESLGEVEIVDVKKAVEIPEASSLQLAAEPHVGEAQQPETPAIPAPSSEFVVDPKTGRFYRSRSLKNTKMDPRKRRFLFKTDTS